MNCDENNCVNIAIFGFLGLSQGFINVQSTLICKSHFEEKYRVFNDTFSIVRSYDMTNDSNEQKRFYKEYPRIFDYQHMKIN